MMGGGNTQINKIKIQLINVQNNIWSKKFSGLYKQIIFLKNQQTSFDCILSHGIIIRN